MKIINSAYKDFKSEGDVGLFYLKNIEVQCQNSRFTGCKSINGAGGSIYIKNTNDKSKKVIFKNVQFLKCKADYGGALYVYSKSKSTNVSVDSCIFKENVAKELNANKFGGGAIYISITKGEIVYCQFISNYGSSQIKVTDPSKESIKIMNSFSLNFFNCNFVANN